MCGGADCRAARYHIRLHSPKIPDPRFNGWGCEVLTSFHPKSEIATLHGSVSSPDDLVREWRTWQTRRTQALEAGSGLNIQQIPFSGEYVLDLLRRLLSSQSCFETSTPPGLWQSLSSHSKFVQFLEKNFLQITGELKLKLCQMLRPDPTPSL